MNEHKYTYLKISHEHSPNVLRAGVARQIMVVVLGFGWRTLMMKNKFGPSESSPSQRPFCPPLEPKQRAEAELELDEERVLERKQRQKPLKRKRIKMMYI